MLKNLFTLSIIFLLISCSGNKKTSQENEEQIKILEAQEESPAPYQTIADEDQAVELNAAEEQKIEEIEVKDRVFFGYDSFQLDDEAKKILDTQISWLKSDINIKVVVEGHADERGTREYNIALGERRAKSVRDYLVAGGVDMNRITIISYGKERPAFFGASAEIFAKNRRAVTVIN